MTTFGRRTGRARAVIVGYFEDGPNLVTMAINDWGDAEPAWCSTSKPIPTSRG